MPSWKGNPKNPVPNPVQEDINRSEKRIDENRSFPVRRDTDVQKDQKITLYDVDKVIFDQLEKMNLHVVDDGKTVKIPIFYGAPEKWVSAKRDGVIRDNKGKIQLPAMIFRRTNSENDDTIEIFNRYLKYPVMQKHSVKNKYTQFAQLTSKNVPVHEVFSITMADHMVFTYSFIIWTEYHEQMNDVIETIKFNSKDYWGSEKGFRFRVRVEAFSHTLELSADDDRMVKTEFNIITNGYILPEKYQMLDKQYPTTDKLFTPKKLIMGMEVVASDYDMKQLNNTSDKWKSKVYPNLDKNDVPEGPRISWTDTSETSVIQQSMKAIVQSLQLSNVISGVNTNSTTTSTIIWQPVPAYPDSPGEEGWLARDESYIYTYIGGQWRRVAISSF